ncbi:MAG: cysteine hydrolase [Mycobacterium pseudokansasii]|uniref:Peroxyureidoacrylate/ureidoacrylate amidohydrolase RutB n=1 Tax=Mycobacterium pseudokansasii TaxID=2341080 RepID=A0A498R0X1_9MYCO|nr:cysteine hydrolase [Mycobacterium pseudokansasii]KZS67467.1 isochorismatase [Mycobacterium kansasii]MBY0389534.1 cysteine hydrolase [Mycobacterium pseudokansasii]VBA33821.1 Peroxyureidoacrylate/ureidoacrylate amidohydrolase RutB [Mycobacterium pseudokansasii]VBA35372.1 Peroxyureidoacrylate/ureidoacrylate amidohydrolase RutB [Mycobacterium pseudokansasii]VBA56403.1 Peroxyureidoacrylate/ureidoacrylate amidohydrolase RutB [Mycobacterium pseudokansasii]
MGAELVPLGAVAATAWRVSEDLVDTVRNTPHPRPVRLAAEPQNLLIDLSRTGIVIIDMQNDFCAQGGWLDHIGVDITPVRKPISPLRGLLPALRDSGVPVVWVNWGNRPDRLNLSPSLLHAFNPVGTGVGIGDPLPHTGARVLQRDSWAAAIVDELQPVAADIRVDKYRMSGFWDTVLDSILRNLGLTTLLFGGVNTDQCVMTTLQDANFLGYDCILVTDCTATSSPEYCWEATLYNVKQCFGFVTDSAALRQALS